VTDTAPAPAPAAADLDGGESVAAEIRRYLDHLTVERGLARNSLVAYHRDLRRYASWLAESGVIELQAVSEADIAAFGAALRRGNEESPPLAASSVARALVSVRGLHRFAAREGRVEADVSAPVRPPVPPKRLPRALSVEQITALLEAAGGDTAGEDAPRALRDRALLEFLYGTGSRISEAVGLDLDELDLEGGAVRLFGKGSRERIVPVGRLAREALSAYLVRGRPALISRGTPAVFLSARGNRLSRQSAWTILQETAGRAGIDPAVVSPHVLRHSYATHLLDGGADVRVVQELLGHASVTTTQVYTLVTVDRLREVYAAAHPRARA
jgi:integrase/recombinase XerD